MLIVIQFKWIIIFIHQVCQNLGWKGNGKKWDILPIVLSADGEDPEWFDLPKEYAMEVKFTHPE